MGYESELQNQKSPARFRNLAHFLAVRYTAWDLVRRGLVGEVSETSCLLFMKSNPEGPGFWERLGLLGYDSHLDERELLIWLAICRTMTLDQIITLDPENAQNNVEMLLKLRVQQIAASR